MSPMKWKEPFVKVQILYLADQIWSTKPIDISTLSSLMLRLDVCNWALFGKGNSSIGKTGNTSDSRPALWRLEVYLLGLLRLSRM
jgi:hypothetical protein